MKYHSPIRIVIIAILTVSVFAVVSLFSVFLFGAYSPSEYLVSSVLDSLSAGDDLEFSFSSLDKNIRGNITINDVSLCLDKNEVFSSESIRISSSFFSIIKSIIWGQGEFDIEIHNPMINIQHRDIDYITSLFPSSPSETGSGEKKGRGERDYTFNLHFYSLDLSYSTLSLSDAEVYLTLSNRNLLERVELRLDEFNFDWDGFILSSAGIEGRIISNGGAYSFDGGFDRLSLSYGQYVANLEGIAISSSFNDLLSFSLPSLSAQLSFSSGNIAYSDDFYSRLYPAYLSLEKGKVDASLSLVVASYRNLAISLADLSLSYDLNSADVSLDSVNTVIYEETNPVLTLKNTIANGNMERRNATATIGELSASIGRYTAERLSNAVSSSVNVSLNASDGVDLSLNSTLHLDSDESLLDGIEGALSFSVSYSDKVDSVELGISSLRIPKLDDSIEINAFYDPTGLNAGITYSDSVQVRIDMHSDLILSAQLNSLNLYDFTPFISEYAPFLENYIGQNTVLNGILDASLTPDDDALFGYSGDVSYAIGLEGIEFINFSFNAASSLSASLTGDKAEISLFNITTDLIRLGFSGSLDLNRYLPDGRVILENTESGNDYVTLDLSLDSDREYTFDLRIPAFEAMSLTGLFNFEDVSHLYSDASLYTESRSYEFFVDMNFNTQQIRVENENAMLYLSYGDQIISYLDLDDFALPRRESSLDPARLMGRVDFSFDVANQVISASSSDFRISNLYLLPGSPDVNFSFDLDNDGIHLYDVSFISSAFTPFRGEALYNFDEYSFALSFGNSSEQIDLSITPYEDYMTGLFVIRNLNAGRLGLEDSVLNASLSGRGADFDSLSFSGDFNLTGNDTSIPLRASAEIFISSSEISISNFSYVNGTLSIGIPQASVDSRSGSSSLLFDLSYVQENRDRSYPIDLSFALDLTARGNTNLYTFIRDLVADNFSSLSGTLCLTNLGIDNTLLTGEKWSDMTFDGDTLSLRGTLATGTYDIHGRTIDMDIDLDPIASLSFSGNFMNAMTLDLGIRNFSLYLANIFLVMPVVTFTPGSLANGELTILGSLDDIHMYGSLWSDNIEFDVFWLPGEKVIAHDMTFTVWDNSIESAMTSLTTVNADTGERQGHKGRLCFYLTKDLAIDYYTIDVYVKEGREINFRLPMQSQNIDIVGRVSGEFHLLQRGMQSVSLTGKMNIMDTQLSLGMHAMPTWYTSKIKTSYDFNLNLVRNNTFVFPLGANPIISATADENQALRFYSNEEGGFGASGAIELRAGEIYYFQRSFFIREGNINFRENGMNSIDPVINLRASLRAFDSEGEKVDIYLVLREASLTNFTPTFESSPAKDLSEIMSILGQAIVNTDGGSGTNLGNVVSLLTTGVDVLQRIGFIQQNDNGLQMSIRNSLNLDTFSLHTNIIGNLVYDAVLASQNASRWNVSPLARYLDGTALYIGKYVTPELYFEALAHLSAQRSTGEENISTFLSSDLSLDIEVSLEWENPLCTVTLFTQPRSLTIDDAFRYVGLTFSKRFVF